MSIKHLLLRVLSFSLIAPLLVSSNLIAQTTITGKVYSLNGDNECNALSSQISLNNITLEILDASNNAQATTSTNPSGIYSASVNASEVKIIPSVSGGSYDNWDLGVNGYDIALIDYYLQGEQVLACPFSRIAADVNNSGSITLADTALIYDLCMGVIPTFPDVSNWRFVSANYTRTDSGNRDIFFPSDFWNQAVLDPNGNQYPFQAIYNYDNSTAYDYNGAAGIWMDKLNIYPVSPNCATPNWDFIAMKSGDVSGSISPSSFTSDDADVKSKSNTKITKPIGQLKSNATYEIEFRAQAAQPIIAFQMGIELVGCEVVDIQPDSTLQNYNTNRHFVYKPMGETAENQEFRTIWIAPYPETVSLEEQKHLFTVRVTMEQELDAAEMVEFKDSILETLFFSKEGDVEASLFVKVTAL